MRYLYLTIATAIVFGCASCAPPSVPQVPISSKNDASDPTVTQELYGVRAIVSVHRTAQSQYTTHMADVTLINTADEAKKNVTIEQLTFDSAWGAFRSPPSVDLWSRGSEASFLAVETWNLPRPPRGDQLLAMTVCFEERSRLVVAQYHWMISIDGTAAATAANPPQHSSR